MDRPAAAARRKERRFFFAMALALVAGVFAGFSRTFYLKPLFPEAQALAAEEPFFYVHGVLFTLWMLLLATQVQLVRTGRVVTHRSVGQAGVLLAAAVVVVGAYGALIAANRPGGFIGVPMAPEAFLLVPLLDVTLFALFVGLAVAWRQDTQSHKRLMLLATLSISQAAFVRITPAFLGDFAGPIMQLVLTLAFVVALATWDVRTTRRLHPVTLWAGIPLFLSQPLRIVVAETESWKSIGLWLMGLM